MPLEIPENLILPLLVFALLLASLVGGIFRLILILFVSYRAARWLIPMTAGVGAAQVWYML